VAVRGTTMPIGLDLLIVTTGIAIIATIMLGFVSSKLIMPEFKVVIL